MLETKNKTTILPVVEPAATPLRGPLKLNIERREDGRLWIEHEGKKIPLRVRYCFPWSDPGRYVSLCDEKENEIILVRNLKDLVPEDRELIESALAKTRFVLEIESVQSTAEEFEIRAWHVQTRQGPRKFQTPRDDWPYRLADGGLLIRDVAGDLYFIRDPRTLDAGSQRILAPFID